MEKYSAIKTDLTTSGLTQKQIAEKHDVGVPMVNHLNTGQLHPEVEPITPTQTKRQEAKKIRESITKNPIVLTKKFFIEKEMPITVSNQAGLDIVLRMINKNPVWPKTIILPMVDADSSKFVMDVLEELQAHLQLELSICRIKIHALETGDRSNLSEKMKEELDAQVEEIIAARKPIDEMPKELLVSDNQNNV